MLTTRVSSPIDLLALLIFPTLNDVSSLLVIFLLLPSLLGLSDPDRLLPGLACLLYVLRFL